MECGSVALVPMELLRQELPEVQAVVVVPVVV